MAIVLMASLTGCVMAPGGHIDYSAETPDIDHLVDIQAITPQLVAQYRRELNGDVATLMPASLRDEIEHYEYRVGPGDVLSIVVYDHPELTIPAGAERSAVEAGNTVRPDGTIFYPYIGRVQVGGRTTDEIRTLLTRRLASFITNPQVDVSVAAYRSQKLYVSGAIGSARTLPITSVPMTVLDAISEVGGASENGDWHNVILNRDGRKESLSLYALLRDGDQTQNRLLRDGDVLHVPTRETQNVAVLGQVRSPGNLNLGNERITLTDALARSGGIDEIRARPSGIFVIRVQPETSDKIATVYQLDINNATALTMGTHFPLQPQDVIYVTAAPISRWNSVISQLLPSLTFPGRISGTATQLGDL
ncbi:polysaccharide export protein [Halomonas sp. BC04]|uniref:polysaccharide export protein n=1 Tax=Halomonas sp. BC04 TaxID=1403540 RepID=UPI0022B04FAF|nr:polysaccharide export protein [Halomonas sp. BC04]